MIPWAQKHPKTLTALVLLALFLIGLFTAGDYGMYFDQQSEAMILRENLKEYAWYLDDDEALRYYDRIELPRIVETREIDHGMAAFYPLAPFMTRMDSDQASLFLLWNALAWCWFMAGLLALYGLCRKQGMSRPAALTGVLVLYLSPRFFAEGHYNNKDTVLLALALLVMFAGVCLWEKPTLLRGLAFAFFGALCANTKVIGVCIFGVMGLACVAALTARRQWNKRTLGVALSTLLFFVVFYALLTPASWADPWGYVQYLFTNAVGFSRWNNYVLFRGMVFLHCVDLPFYYLPYFLIVTMPLYVVALCAFGQAAALRTWWKSRKIFFSATAPLLLLCATINWSAPLGLAMLTDPVVYNGWRHFYFLFAGLSVLAAWGLECLVRFFQKYGKRWQKWAAGILAALCLCTSAVGIALNHPYQYAYFNALGHLLCPVPLEEGMELDYWCVSTLDALKAAAEAQPEDRVLTYSARDNLTLLALEYHEAILPKALDAQLHFVHSTEEATDLIISNPTYHLMHGVPIPEDYELLTTVESYGNTMMEVYQHRP